MEMLDMAIRAPRDLCDMQLLGALIATEAVAAAAIAMGIKAIKHTGSTEFKFTIYKQMFLCSHERPSSCRAHRNTREHLCVYASV